MITLIITAHEEGALLAATIGSVKKAIECCSVAVRPIIVLDSADEVTTLIASGSGFPCYKTGYSDVAQARNWGLHLVDTPWAAYLDGDDLVSSNWLEQAYQTAQAHPADILHQEVVVSFGRTSNFWYQRDSSLATFNPAWCLSEHLWTAPIFAATKVACKIGYRPNYAGFGFEDYDFNVRALALGHHHIPVPGTALFVRLKDMGSMNRQQHASRAVWRPNRFERFVVSNGAVKLPADLRFPQWLIPLWEEQNQFDAALWPTERVAYLDHELVDLGPSWSVLQRSIGSPINQKVFVANWLRRGGADECLLQQLAQNPKSIVVFTEPEAIYAWRDRIPADTAVVHFGDIVKLLSAKHKALLLQRFLLNLECAEIHLFNSPLGHAVVASNAKCLAPVTLHSFCADITPDGRKVSAAYDTLQKVHVNKVVTDNQAYANDLKTRFPTTLVEVKHYRVPLPSPDVGPKLRGRGDQLTVLWASRMDWQKAPEILLQVAAKCSQYDILFEVFGDSMLDGDDAIIETIASMPNVYFIRGEYADLPYNECDVVMYTSRYDGASFAVRTAALAGRPVLAPRVGGIHECPGLIECNTPDEYVSALLKMLYNPDCFLEQSYIAQKFCREVNNAQPL